ncbi:hypothetical protein HAX54_007638, partial [Datura stramonium]|nr:hypothetical protein [Datura stramonium]
VWVMDFRLTASHLHAVDLHQRNADAYARKMSSSRRQDKGKAPALSKSKGKGKTKDTLFTKREWHQILDAPTGYYPNMVVEFYASYQVRRYSMKHIGRVDEFLNLLSVMAQGVEVDIALDIIISIYLAEPIAMGTKFAEKIATKGNQLQWVTNTIAIEQPIWATIGGKIPRQDLHCNAKLCLNLVFCRLMPSKNGQRVHVGPSILIAFIITRVHINFSE